MNRTEEDVDLAVIGMWNWTSEGLNTSLDSRGTWVNATPWSLAGLDVTGSSSGHGWDLNASAPPLLRGKIMDDDDDDGGDVPQSTYVLVLLSLLFFLIVLVGILGNGLVIVVVLTDRKMRQSVTNLLIVNLAVADLLTMLLGVPEIVMVMMGRGYLLGPHLCRATRYLLVVCLYSSVLSLSFVCFERFVAIVFPIKAHVLCTRRKVLAVIAVIWPLALLCGLPTAVFNRLMAVGHGGGPDDDSLLLLACQLVFPEPHLRHYVLFQTLESLAFYFLPLAVQVALYAVVARRLYASMEELHTRFQMRSGDSSASIALNGGGGGGGGGGECRNGGWVSGTNGAGTGGGGGGTGRAAETIRARKGVVKMLVASVAVYALSYSPVQVAFLYGLATGRALHGGWSLFVLTMVLTYLNAAANPVLYSIFSQNFRRNFKRCLCCLCYGHARHEFRRTRFDSFDSRGVSRRVSTTRTTVSRV